MAFIEPSELAKRQNLSYAGYGYWKNTHNQITHQTVGSRLIKLPTPKNEHIIKEEYIQSKLRTTYFSKYEMPSYHSDILDKNEIRWIWYYTGANGYKKVNNFLREPNKEDMYDEDEIEVHERYNHYLQSSLNKLPNYKNQVFRWSSVPKDIFKKMKVGGVYADAAFTSTSFKDDDEYANSFISGSTSTVSVKFVIKSKTGKNISSFNDYGEPEVLFKPQTKFKIEKIENTLPGTKYTKIVFLEEI